MIENRLLLPQLIQQMLNGDRRALARLFTALERDRTILPLVMKGIHSSPNLSYSIGITGPPGAGKSTIVDGLIQVLRDEGVRVGVLAVDPSSPFTGGAILGDRIRMQKHSLDDGVFIRSISTKGMHGGLSRIVGASVNLLGVYGQEMVIVETVGVGQTELDIMEIVDTVVVVVTPESGDAVQAMKAGLSEIADIFVVNKADRDGAARLASTLKSTLVTPNPDTNLVPQVLLTEAHSGNGIVRLHEAINKHRQILEAESLLKQLRRDRRLKELIRIFTDTVNESATNALSNSSKFNEIKDMVSSGVIDPYSAVEQIIQNNTLLSSLIGLKIKP